jgi:hypothetical protein
MEHGAKSAVGIDIIKPKGLHEKSTWQFMKADLNAVDRIKEFNGEKFDSILAFDILEYLDSPYLFFKIFAD